MEPAYSVWSEFMPFAAVERVLSDLCRSGTGLLLAVHDGDWEQPSFASLWRKAADCGIPLRAWLLLKPEDGYWVNAGNIDAVESLVDRFLSFMDSNALPVTWLTLDLEPPPALQTELTQKLKKLDLVGALKLLRQGSHSAALGEARAKLTALVERLHARNVRVHAVTMPFVIDDLEAGDSRIQAALGVPFSGVDWDEVSFMVYRAEYRKILGRISPRVVYDYARRARALFGEKAAVDLGEVGTVGYPEPVPGYLETRDLEADVGAALAAGVAQLHVYSLDGILEQGGLAKWLKEFSPKTPARSLGVSLLERGLVIGRRLLPRL